MKAAIYCRTSSDDETGEDKSIPDQVQDCLELCKQQGYEVVDVIREPNRSGRLYPTGAPVAEFDQAIKDYTAKLDGKTSRDGLAKVVSLLPQIDVVVARDLERIARPLSESMLGSYLAQTFKIHNIKTHTMRDGLQDPSDWSVHFVNTVRSMAVDSEIKRRRLHSIAKLEKLVNEGYVAANPQFFGYSYVKRQTVEVNETEAATVRMIFSIALEGKPFMQIVKALNHQKANGKFWVIQEVLKIIDRPEYVGYSRSKSGKLIPSKVYPPILKIGLNQWLSIQKVRKANREKIRRGAKGKVIRPLTGLVQCGFCSASMSITNGPKLLSADLKKATGEVTVYYLCNRCYQAEGDSVVGCKMTRVREEDLLRLALPFVLPLIQRKHEKQLTDKQKAEALKAAESELQALKDKENELIDSGLSPNQIKRQLERISSQIEAAEIKVAELSVVAVSKIEARGKATPSIASAIEITFYQRDRIQLALREAIEKIVVWAFKVDIYIKGHALPCTVERVPIASAKRLPAVYVGVQAKGQHSIYLMYKSAISYKASVQAIPDSDYFSALGNEIMIRVSIPGCEKAVIRDIPTQLKPKKIFEAFNIEVFTLGENPKYGERKKARGEEVRDLPDYVLESRSRP